MIDKKVLLGLTTLLAVSLPIVVISSSSGEIYNSGNSGYKTLITPPSEVNYEGYHRVTKIGTLLSGASVVFVGTNASGVAASTTTISNKKLVINTNITVSDGHLTYTSGSADPFTYTYTSSKHAFKNSSDQYLDDSAIDSSMMGFAYTASPLLFDIAYTDGVANIKASGSSWYLYLNNATDAMYLHKTACNTDIYINVDSVLTCWVNTYLHMAEYETGQCNKYFSTAKSALLAMDNYVMYDLYHNSDFSAAKERYEAWAAHLEEEPYQE